MTVYRFIAKKFIHREIRMNAGDILSISDDDLEMISEKQYQNINIDHRNDIIIPPYINWTDGIHGSFTLSGSSIRALEGYLYNTPTYWRETP